MMKLLLLLAVLLLAYVLWRAGRIEKSRRGDSGQHKPGKPQDMVSCPICSVHLPRAEAVAGADGRLYCSQEHRLRSGD